jgi:hypothetical protein
MTAATTTAARHAKTIPKFNGETQGGLGRVFGKTTPCEDSTILCSEKRVSSSQQVVRTQKGIRNCLCKDAGGESRPD